MLESSEILRIFSKYLLRWFKLTTLLIKAIILCTVIGMQKNLLSFFCHPLKSHNCHDTHLNVSNKSSYQKSCTKVYGLIQFFVLFCKGQMHLIVFRKWLPRCCCISSSFGWCRGVYFLKRKTARQISVYNNEVSRAIFAFFCLYL